MATSVFVSPGVYTKEQNFSVFAATLGTTYLGLVGLTQKGPAFLPTQINSLSNYNTVFGGTDPLLPAPVPLPDGDGTLSPVRTDADEVG